MGKESTLFNKWIERGRDARGWSDSTIRARTEAYNLYFNVYKGVFTFDSFEGFIAWMKVKRKNAVRTIVRRGGDIRLFFRYCNKNGVVKDQDMADINDFKLPAIFSETPEPVTPEEAEQAILAGTEIMGTENMKIRSNKKIARLVLRFCLRTGLRRGELLRLTPGDLRLEQCKTWVLNTKSRKRELQPITLDIIDELRSYIEENEIAPEDKLFPIDHHALNGYLHRGSKKAGLPIRLHLHDLRDTYLSDQLRRRVSMQTVKDNARHKDYSSLAKYSGAQMEDRIAAANSSPIVEGGLTSEQKLAQLKAIVENCGIKYKNIKIVGNKVEVQL
jgi:integrase